MKDVLDRLGLEAVNPGTWCGQRSFASADAPLIDSHSPSSGQLIASVRSSTAAEYDTVMKAAQQAFLEWRNNDPLHGMILGGTGFGKTVAAQAVGGTVEPGDASDSGELLTDDLIEEYGAGEARAVEPASEVRNRRRVNSPFSPTVISVTYSRAGVEPIWLVSDGTFGSRASFFVLFGICERAAHVAGEDGGGTTDELNELLGEV